MRNLPKKNDSARESVYVCTGPLFVPTFVPTPAATAVGTAKSAPSSGPSDDNNNAQAVADPEHQWEFRHRALGSPPQWLAVPTHFFKVCVIGTSNASATRTHRPFFTCVACTCRWSSWWTQRASPPPRRPSCCRTSPSTRPRRSRASPCRWRRLRPRLLPRAAVRRRQGAPRPEPRQEAQAQGANAAARAKRGQSAGARVAPRVTGEAASPKRRLKQRRRRQKPRAGGGVLGEPMCGRWRRGPTRRSNHTRRRRTARGCAALV